MTVRVIIFDFDGTIADTKNTIIEITNRLAKEFGYQPLDELELAQFQHLSSREVIKRSKISLFRIPFLLKRVKEELGKEIDRLEPVTGIENALVYLKQRGYRLGIITSNSRENVDAFLEKHRLSSLFDFVYSGSSLFRKHKVIRDVLKQRKLAARKVIYVGDETRDIQAAQKSKVRVIAVSWGFNSASVLAQYQPDFLLKKPEELIEVVASLQKLKQA